MIVVTGGAGFLGRHIVETLAARAPDRTIRVVDLDPSRGSWPSGIEFERGSVLEPEVVRAAVDGADAVVHLAAVVEPEAEDEKRLHRVNVDGARNVFTASVAAGCDLFVHMSSSGVYGPPSRKGPFREDDPANPKTPYQRSKWRAEQALREVGSPSTTLNMLRPAGVFGPGSRLELPRYRKILRQRFVLELSGGVRVHPTYVADVAHAVVALLEQPAPDGAVFNIGGPRPLLLQDLQALIADEVGVRRRRIVVPTWVAAPAARVVEPLLARVGQPRPHLQHMCKGGVVSAAVDDSRFRGRHPGVPATDLRTGVREHIQWARSEGLLQGDE